MDRFKKQRVRLAFGGLLWTAAVGLAILLGGPTADSAKAYHDKRMRIAAGERVVVTCVACHRFTSSVHMVGPHLVRVLGRRAGSVAGYEYSAAMRNSGIVWDEESLTRFLRGPERMVSGTKMPLSGMSDSDIAALIQYMKEL